MYSKELIRGTLKPIILKLLTEHGKMYGYQICQVIKTQTGGELSIREGSLYPALYKLKDEGLVTVEMIPTGNRVRQYYSLAKPSRVAVKDQLGEFSKFLKTMNSIFHPENNPAV